MNLLGVECIKCHKRNKFPSVDMAETYGWSQVNYNWYCPNCDFEDKNESSF